MWSLTYTRNNDFILPYKSLHCHYKSLHCLIPEKPTSNRKISNIVPVRKKGNKELTKNLSSSVITANL